MSSYLELPTYTYEKMTMDEKRLFRRDFEKPVVIRGLYEPEAKKMTMEKIISMFDDVRLPIEVYKTENTHTCSASVKEYTMEKLFKHWKTNKSPLLYCAEVDLFEQDVSEKLLKSLHNPKTEQKVIDELLLYLGKNHKTGLHLHVNNDFILNQLFGSKTVYIFGNYDNPNIRKNSFFKFSSSNFAVGDFFEMDHSKMKIYKTILYPGDSLTIPPWCWHATHGHGINMSITETFLRRDDSYIWKNPNLLLEYFFEGGPQSLINVFVVIFILIFVLRCNSTPT